MGGAQRPLGPGSWAVRPGWGLAWATLAVRRYTDGRNGDPPHPASPHFALNEFAWNCLLCQAAYLNFVPDKRLSL